MTFSMIINKTLGIVKLSITPFSLKALGIMTFNY